MTIEEFHEKYKNIRTSHSDTCECRDGFGDYEICTCGLNDLWDQRNVDLRSTYE